VLQEFDVTLLADQVVKPAASLGLWPDRPVWLALHSQEPRVQPRVQAV
jgi:hypothetical protein